VATRSKVLGHCLFSGGALAAVAGLAGFLFDGADVGAIAAILGGLLGVTAALCWPNRT
jgi:hypothetical protein